MRSSAMAKGVTGLLPLVIRHSHHPLQARQDEPVPSDDLTLLFPQSNSSAVLEGAGLNDLPQTDSTLSRWEDGRVPRSCADILQYTEERLVGGDCSVDSLVVYNLTYTDCSDPWILCQCSEAADILDASVENFGRLPVTARENVRSLILSGNHSYDGENQVAGAALAQQADLIMYGTASISVFIHETAHIVDLVLGNGDEDGLSYSQQERWRDIVDDDTCVLNDYSTTSYTEAYAETAVMAAYELNIGSLDEVVDYECMSNAMDAVTEQLGDFFTYEESATCSPVEDRFDPVEVWCVEDGEARPCTEEELESRASRSVSATGMAAIVLIAMIYVSGLV